MKIKEQIKKQIKTISLMLALFVSNVYTYDVNADNRQNVEADNRLYHVELSIFTNNSTDSDSTENWPRDLVLSYPTPLVTLVHELPGNSSHHPTAENTSDTAANNNSTDATITLLPESEKQLTPAIKRISRSGKQRVLFHENWIQAINSHKTAINIAVHGGGQFDDHFELEGSIRLSRQRYLHIETNLWLSKFAINVGQEGEAWPLLPLQPYIPQHASDSKGINSPGFGAGSRYDNEKKESINSSDFQWNELRDFGSQFQAILNSQYLTERVVSMRQHRKMRSKELHYIDHPEFGLILHITPYEAPAPEEPTPESMPEKEEIESSP